MACLRLAKKSRKRFRISDDSMGVIKSHFLQQKKTPVAMLLATGVASRTIGPEVFHCYLANLARIIARCGFLQRCPVLALRSSFLHRTSRGGKTLERDYRVAVPDL